MRPRDGWRATARVSLLLCFATPGLMAQRAAPGRVWPTAAADSRVSRGRQRRAGSGQRRDGGGAKPRVQRGAVSARAGPRTAERSGFGGGRLRSGHPAWRRRSPKPTIGSASCSGSRAGPPTRSPVRRGRRVSTRGCSTRSTPRRDPLVDRDLAGALPALTAAVALRPGHAEARYYLGITLEGLGRLEPAIAELRTAVRLNPDAGDARTGSAWRSRHRRSGRRDRAAPGRGHASTAVRRRAQQPRAGALAEGTRRRGGRRCCVQLIAARPDYLPRG